MTIAAGTPVAAATQAGNACFAGCKTCSVKASATDCTVTNDGFTLDTTTTSGKSTVVACSTDKSCGKCTWDAVNKKAACTAAGAGYSWASASSTATLCPVGQGNAAGNTSATCTVCTAANNCRSCLDVGFCTTCAPGFVLDSTKGTCTAYAGAVFGTCLKANAATENDCQSCDDT